MRASVPRAVVAASIALALACERPAIALEAPPPLPAYVPPPDPAASKKPKGDPIWFEIGFRAGFGVRTGSGPNIPITSRIGGVFGFGLAVSPTPRFAVGVAWERSSLGAERGTGDAADVDVGRSLDMFWGTVRLHLIQTERFNLLVQIAPGLGIQHASANVLIFPAPSMRPTAYACSESGGPGFGVRAGLGAEVRLGGPMWFTADAQFDHVQMSTGPLGDCVPGMGALNVPGMRFGLAYRLDVTRWLR